MKKILTIIAAVLIVCGLLGLCIGLGVHFSKTSEQKPTVQCEHKITDGKCEKCGKTQAELSWKLDIVTKDCNIKFFVGDEKKHESFGVGTNGHTVEGLLDNTKVIAVSVLSDTTKINVYKCEYAENGKFTGYPVDEETTLFGDKKYNKTLVATLKVTSPLIEICSDKDCLYIFEKVETN